MLVSLALSIMGAGCWSSGQEGQFASSGSKKLVNPEDYYRSVGKGKNKTKVSLSRREKAELRFQALKKLESEAQ